jgi:non-ribosomal peptide synthetase component F
LSEKAAVADILQHQDYSLQANRKTREGSSHPYRDAQFQHINEQTQAFQQRGAPVVSVDAKKKLRRAPRMTHLYFPKMTQAGCS